MSPLSEFFAWIARRRAARALREAERQRNAIMRQIAFRQAHRREFVPMYADLRRATEASLRASLGRVVR